MLYNRSLSDPSEKQRFDLVKYKKTEYDRRKTANSCWSFVFIVQKLQHSVTLH